MIRQSSSHDEARSGSPDHGRKRSLEIDQLIGSTRADTANALSLTVAISVAVMLSMRRRSKAF
jgi:hypothetical protein